MVDYGRRVAGAPKFVTVTPNYFGPVSMELVACHASGGHDFRATLRLLENLGTASKHTHTHISGSGQGQLEGTCKCSNEPSGSIKCGEFLDYLRTDQLLKKGCAAWSN